MVDTIHDAGLEVILDVVYNHTGEGDELGPTLSFRGIDNLSYYRSMESKRGRLVNDTGCTTQQLQHYSERPVMPPYRWLAVPVMNWHRTAFGISSKIGMSGAG